MRINKLYTMFILLLGFTLFVAAEPEREGEGDGPVKSGYVVVTPNSASASPEASVIFGHMQGNTTTEAGVLASNLTNNANVFISVNGRLQKNIGVAVANPNNRTVAVTLSLTDGTGAAVGSPHTFSVNAYNQTARFVTELFGDSMPRDFTGTLSITSDAPVALTGLRVRGENLSTIPLADLSTTRFSVPVRNNSVGGPGALVFPVAAFGGGFQSTIILMNTTASPISGKVDFFNPDGSPLSVKLNNQTASTFNYTIPAKGVFLLEDRAREGDSDAGGDGRDQHP
jgi:hypothetical protein